MGVVIVAVAYILNYPLVKYNTKVSLRSVRGVLLFLRLRLDY